MSEPIKLKGSFRITIMELLLDYKRAKKREEQIIQDLERAGTAAAAAQYIDMKKYVLDVDTLEFIERPAPPAPPEAQAAPEPKPEWKVPPTTE